MHFCICTLTLTNGQITINLTSYSTTAQMTAAIAAALGPYVLTTALTNTLAAYTDTTGLTTLLAAKQSVLQPGTGISIVGATISSTHIPLTLQLDGTTQTGATTLNFVGNNATLQIT